MISCVSGATSARTSPYWLTGSPIQRSTSRPATRSATSGQSMTRRPLRRTVTMASDRRLLSPGAAAR